MRSTPLENAALGVGNGREPNHASMQPSAMLWKLRDERAWTLRATEGSAGENENRVARHTSPCHGATRRKSAGSEAGDGLGWVGAEATTGNYICHAGAATATAAKRRPSILYRP
ncbi:uncharacterized protein UTRI_04174 [Ustilago trichophora]|uniref:Uncharacterized protein n=1 Tax=Ustilago trichophora TaxID=86804 RepID=A0A5C3E934_9BASI|nr:uncharacterized protein UTRI_04174 [Ustilago trichophora]